MAELATLQTRLTEAEAALHALATGSMVEEVWRDGRRVTYTASNIARLREYIAYLNSEIAAAQAAADGGTRRRPQRIYY